MNVFNEAIESHAEWKMLLKRHIDIGNMLDVISVANCHVCDLGQWIYGEGLRFNRLPSFERLCANHELFHRAAAEVVIHSDAGEKDEALALMKPNGLYSQASKNLVHALMECSRELTQHVVKFTPHPGKILDVLNKKSGNKIHAVEHSLTVLEALQYMVDHHIGSLVVYKDKAFVGFFTERGFAQNILSKGVDFLNSPIAEVLDKDVVSINAFDAIQDAMTLMTTTHKRHLPVMDNNQLIGVVSIGDVIKEVLNEDNENLTQLKGYMRTMIAL